MLTRLGMFVCLALVLVAVAGQADALTLLSPTQDQIVRENVRITIPLSSLPADIMSSGSDTGSAAPRQRPFIALHVGDAKAQSFVAAMSGDSGVVSGGNVSFYWNSKAPYRDPAQPKVEKFFKDGNYVIRVDVHDRQGKVVDSATVRVQLRNKVPRSNPAPAVTLVHRLAFGQSRTYRVHADAQVYEMVSGVGLPIAGGLGIASEARILQTVDDVRADGTVLLRCRVDKDAWVSSFGRRRVLYENEQFSPQLYRLISKQGHVIKSNVFSRQAQYTITDVLPVLPGKPVKEGDSWPSAMTLKIEGITNPVAFSGTSMLDSFEWQDGRECAKIISRMTGEGRIMLAGGKIRSESTKVQAQMTTFFDYRSGTLVKNDVVLDFPAVILPGAGEAGSETEDVAAMQPDMSTQMEEDELDQVYGTRPRTPGGLQERGARQDGLPEGTKKGSVQINVEFRLEK